MTCRVEWNIQTGLFKSLQPERVVEAFTPGIEETALAVGRKQGSSHPPVAPGQDSLQHRYVRLMPVIFDTLFIELGLDFAVDNICLIQEFLLGTHTRPLEWGKWLRYKEGGADGNLTFAIPLILGNFVVPFRNLFSQPRDSLLIFYCLRGLSQHKVKLHLLPAALEGLSGSFQNDFLSQSLVDHVPETLGTGLWRKGQAALADILYLAHNVQGKGVNSKGRQGNVDALISKGVNEEIYQLR